MSEIDELLDASLLATPNPAVMKRFWKSVEKPDGCWLWTGRLTDRGYPHFEVGGKRRRAHRWLWEQLNGPVPEGFELDHLCRNRACVNPDHLEIVTHAVNMKRSKWGAATHCRRGHPFDYENTYVHPSGRRTCRACVRMGRERRAA